MFWPKLRFIQNKYGRRNILSSIITQLLQHIIRESPSNRMGGIKHTSIGFSLITMLKNTNKLNPNLCNIALITNRKSWNQQSGFINIIGKIVCGIPSDWDGSIFIESACVGLCSREWCVFQLPSIVYVTTFQNSAYLSTGSCDYHDVSIITFSATQRWKDKNRTIPKLIIVLQSIVGRFW